MSSIEVPPLYQCPCGLDHREHSQWPMVKEMIDRLGSNIRSTIHGDTYEVPRVYIAFHGIAGYNIPSLAKQYGWPLIRSTCDS